MSGHRLAQIKLWENQPEALRVGGPAENMRYALGGWGENCYRGRPVLKFTTRWARTHAKSCKVVTTFAFFIRFSSNLAEW